MSTKSVSILKSSIFSPLASIFLKNLFVNLCLLLSSSVNSSVFIEDKNSSKSYSTFQFDLNINKGFIRNLNNLKFYYSNIFFSKFSDKHRMNYGIESEVQLPMRLSLIINLGQVYYDSNNTIDNNIDRMSNSSVNLKYNF